MERKKLKNRGFTLVELVVVMVIVGILATISVPMYRNYVQRARAQEGKALVGSVASAAKVYYAEHGSWTAWDITDVDVNADGNTYFTEFTPSGDATTFTVVSVADKDTDAAGITVEATGGTSVATTIDVTGGGL